jgi:hypothetical protein
LRRTARLIRSRYVNYFPLEPRTDNKTQALLADVRRELILMAAFE